MDKAKVLNESWELPPLRSLNDFLLESSRFQLPNIKDLEKWGNRVVNNLVYYQTNYIYMCIAFILLTATLNPRKAIVGICGILLICSLCLYFVSKQPTHLKFKRAYPQVNIIIIVISITYLVYYMSSIIFLLLGIFVSFCVTFIHASLRLRNMKNKLVNKIEGLGFERTPMGILLNYIEDTTGITLRTQKTFIQSLH